jgi:glutamate-1-semialdehyde aminotransferase
MPFPFYFPFKEFYFPLSLSSVSGTTLVDVDGNRYLDFSMGYGSRLFGHDPLLIENESIPPLREIDLPPGFFPGRALQVTEMLKKLTGLDRFYFCTSGTEAVMLAIRLARAATGKKRIALFRGSNHGHYDGVAAAQADSHDLFDHQAATCGIPLASLKNVLLLDYCQEAALECISRNRQTLAAVLVEPFQCRHPELAPASFLAELQGLATQSPFLLIWDELVSGFRLHPAGALGFLGAKADLVLYGKSLANGMPLAAVAGKREIISLLDGGDWQFGDDSRPALFTVPHGGTYHLHPQAVKSMAAVLSRLLKEGPQLQEKLNQQTGALIAALNQMLAEMRAPFHFAGWGSFFAPLWHNPEDQHGGTPLLYFHLIEQGVLLWGLNGFLSTAHSEKDLIFLREALRTAVMQLQSADFLKPAVTPQGCQK